MPQESNFPRGDSSAELPLVFAEAVTESSCGCRDTSAEADDEERRRASPQAAIAQSADQPTAAPVGIGANALGNGSPTERNGSRTERAEVENTDADGSGKRNHGSGREQAASHDLAPSQETADRGMIYAFGTLGYDFGNEARRDTFKQLMPAVGTGGMQVPANPHDARQMVAYLDNDISEARELIWTLNLELTPIYALAATGPFAREVYKRFRELMDGQVLAEDKDAFVERVSIPGRLTGQSVRLFSGQVVPVVEVCNTRGTYGWKVNTLVEAALDAVKDPSVNYNEEAAKKSLDSFLNRVYYDLRNLGRTSRERALNFAATNAFQVAATFKEAVGVGMELDNIEVVKSPFCRMDSDCWDVVLTFFDAENLMKARKLFRFTIDVSDLLPVTLGKVRKWSVR